MELKQLDTTGLHCPMPLMKISVISSQMKPGDILEVVADCPTFEIDVRSWCARLKKTLLFVREEDGYRKTVQIRI
jgi:tRNA 2-thiouridine synthesizing protein A